MSTILLSIKPEYSDRIFLGTKRYEFRRHLAQKNITKILVYSTSPVMMVVGEVEVTDTLAMKPSPLWEETKKYAGITRIKFREYFAGCKMGYAYKLGKAQKYATPQPLSKYNINQAPQSFVYIDDKMVGEY